MEGRFTKKGGSGFSKVVETSEKPPRPLGPLPEEEQILDCFSIYSIPPVFLHPSVEIRKPCSNTSKSKGEKRTFCMEAIFLFWQSNLSVFSLISTGQTSLSQDSEAALMMDYAAAMDSSCKADPPTVEKSVAKVTSDEELSLGTSEAVPGSDPQQSAHKAWNLENGSQQWDTNTLLDQTCEEISCSSLSVSETGSMKKSKGM